MNPKRVALISTGGTIEKTYDPAQGALANRVSVLDILLGQLRLHGVEFVRVRLMNKDSLEMTTADHTLIARTAEAMSRDHDGVLIVHGTDRLEVSGHRTHELIGTPKVPIIFTGAMIPYEFRHSDAVQNITESLLAVQILDPGIYAVFQNVILRFPGVRKNRETGIFVHEEDVP
jgi:L-asparaginase